METRGRKQKVRDGEWVRLSTIISEDAKAMLLKIGTEQNKSMGEVITELTLSK